MVKPQNANGGSPARRALAVAVAFVVVVALAPAAGAQWLYGIELLRFWTQPGDTVTADHVTAGLGLLRRDGSLYQMAENEQMVDPDRAFLQFGYDSHDEQGRYLQATGRLDSDERMPARLLARGGELADHGYEIRYQRSQHFDYPLSRDPYLSDPFTLRLPGLPTELRERALFRYDRRLDRLQIDAGYEFLRQDGVRAGLTRSLLSGSLFGPPAARGLDQWTHRVWLGGRLIAGRWTVDGRFDWQEDWGSTSLTYRPQGDLASGPDLARRRDHDRRNLRLSLGSSYRPSSRLLLLGCYAFRAADASPSLAVDGGADPLVRADEVDVDVRTHLGLLGAVYQPRPGLRLQATARLERLDRTGNLTALGSDRTYERKLGSSDLERTRQVYTALFNWARSPRARCQLSYRFERLDEDQEEIGVEEHLGGNVLVRYESGPRDRTLHEPRLSITHRYGPVTWSNRVRYRHAAVDQRSDILVRQYALGNRDWELFSWQSGLRARPLGGMQLEAGYELVREQFERKDVETSTDWHADRLFGIGTWRLSGLVTLFTTFHIGWEQYGIGGPLPAEASRDVLFSPVEYDARTYRFSPGLSLAPGAGWTLEGNYERVRNRRSVANDSDRWFARLGKRLAPGWSAAATYRRYDFSELRGDDYDADLYTVSVTAPL